LVLHVGGVNQLIINCHTHCTAVSSSQYQVKKTEAQARVEAKNARAIAKKQQEVAAQEQEHRLQVAKAEHAAIDIFLERAAQRRRRTEERVGYRSCLDE